MKKKTIINLLPFLFLISCASINKTHWEYIHGKEGSGYKGLHDKHKATSKFNIKSF